MEQQEETSGKDACQRESSRTETSQESCNTCATTSAATTSKSHIVVPITHSSSIQTSESTTSSSESSQGGRPKSFSFSFIQETLSAPSSPTRLAKRTGESSFTHHFYRHRPLIASSLLQENNERNTESDSSSLIHKIWREDQDSLEGTSHRSFDSGITTTSSNTTQSNQTNSNQPSIPHERHSSSSEKDDVISDLVSRINPIPLFDLSGINLPVRQTIKYRIPLSSLLALQSQTSVGQPRSESSVSSRRGSFTSSLSSDSGASLHVSFSPVTSISVLRRTRTDPIGSFLTNKLSQPSLDERTNHVIDMSFNRQTSTPCRPAPASPRREFQVRKSSLEVPPRPGSSSPTPGSPRLAPSLPSIPSGVPMNHHYQHQQSSHFTATSGTTNFNPSVAIRYPHPAGSSEYNQQLRIAQMMQQQQLSQHQTMSSRTTQSMFGLKNATPQDYISSLLHHQSKSLREMKIKIDDLVYLVERAKNDVVRESKKTYMNLVQDEDIESLRIIEQIIKKREEIRRLKIEVFGYVTEIDSFGDHYLGHEDLKPVPRRTSTGRPMSASPPPVPPRPPFSKVQSQVSQTPQFNELSMRVPLPKGVPRTRRPDTLGYNSYSRTTSMSSSSNNNSPTSKLIQRLFQETNEFLLSQLQTVVPLETPSKQHLSSGLGTADNVPSKITLISRSVKCVMEGKMPLFLEMLLQVRCRTRS